tara:strand:+ start:770 stop:916 length:147 start_codon:yes stop_codon:yes gene_type:complete
MDDEQILLLTEFIGNALIEFKEDQSIMNLENDHYDDVIKCLEYALTGK